MQLSKNYVVSFLIGVVVGALLLSLAWGRGPLGGSYLDGISRQVPAVDFGDDPHSTEAFGKIRSCQLAQLCCLKGSQYALDRSDIFARNGIECTASESSDSVFCGQGFQNCLQGAFSGE